jgi:hypothetical protein
MITYLLLYLCENLYLTLSKRDEEDGDKYYKIIEVIKKRLRWAKHLRRAGRLKRVQNFNEKIWWKETKR